MDIRSIFTGRQEGSTSILIAEVVKNLSTHQIFYICRDETEARLLKQQYFNNINCRSVFLMTYTHFLRTIINKIDELKKQLSKTSLDTIIIFDDWIYTDVSIRKKIATHLITLNDDMNKLNKVIIGGSFDQLSDFEKMQNDDILFNYVNKKPSWCEKIPDSALGDILSIMYDSEKRKEFEDYLNLISDKTV